VQHLALFTTDIFHTLRKMKEMGDMGCGFTFMAPPPPTYYQQLSDRLGPHLLSQLNEEQLKLAKEYGLLIDADKAGERPGLLLQIFTRPLADRPTIFIEIIQVHIVYSNIIINNLMSIVCISELDVSILIAKYKSLAVEDLAK
jgi:4-hydroxyphenylpyruvate dioxygenase